MGGIGDDDLKKKGDQKTQVGEYPDMNVFFNDKLLTVEEWKNHGDCNSGRIIEGMEEGSGEKNFFFHAVLERRIYTKHRFICQL
jgi:hypothetical protein